MYIRGSGRLPIVDAALERKSIIEEKYGNNEVYMAIARRLAVTQFRYPIRYSIPAKQFTVWQVYECIYYHDSNRGNRIRYEMKMTNLER